MARTNGNGKSSIHVDPREFSGILGSAFANRDHRPLVTIGPRSWTQWQLGRLGCPHPAAAVRVQRVIQTLRIKTPQEFIEQAGQFGRYENLGVTCYWLVLALVADLGGDPLVAHGEERSFQSIHSAALKAMSPTKADKQVRGPSEDPMRGKARKRSA